MGVSVWVCGGKVMTWQQQKLLHLSDYVHKRLFLTLNVSIGVCWGSVPYFLTPESRLPRHPMCGKLLIKVERDRRLLHGQWEDQSWTGSCTSAHMSLGRINHIPNRTWKGLESESLAYCKMVKVKGHCSWLP